ncbi:MULTISPECIES: hydroxymethylbilane synthase [Olivibacter]|uniref:Porphobilinogen deaminase n=3 Tax=Sphingobacteriaceae TaxID=84566 RepID=F4C4V5_SPHS2|nr:MULTISPECIES: hydroxymethylbilane synthase [Olivibacter]MDM8173895.1 hydroxymethylbilane synthase [Olivibacter sp. 47]MDX3915079.1 hydroxymethylbilane synthase [Pseudosphingobacterium sp.]QEL03682.1 hydroxymethylbilane synthase [Olivibacter sp. LS-1]
MDRTLIIGTRGSDLALWQANHVKDRLATIGVQAELKVIKTQGDNIQHLRLDKLEGKGFFTKELEEELLAEKIDIAVHSHKDLPTANPPGLRIAAVSEREDPSELLIILKDCVDLKKRLSVKHNAIVGTSSNRRKAQLLAFRPDLEIEDLRGNVNTRLQKLRDEKYDAIMLAKAGVERLKLDLSEFHVEIIPPTEIIPAPAQGVLAIQIRESDHTLYEVLQKLHQKDVAETIGVERKVLNLFEGGCHMPLGCYCRKTTTGYEVWTAKAKDGESFPTRLYLKAESAAGLAEEIVEKFDPDRKLPSSVFITRELADTSFLKRSLEQHHIKVEGRSLIKIFSIINTLDPYILKYVRWVFFSSKNGIENFFKLKPRLSKHVQYAVVGRGSEEALRSHGIIPAFTGEAEGIEMEKVGDAFAQVAAGSTVLFPRAKGSLQTIQSRLTADTKVIDLPVYETRIDEQVEGSGADVLIFTSPTNVEAYFKDNLVEPGQKVISIGNSTGKKLEEIGVQYTLPFSPDELGLAEAVFALNYSKGKPTKNDSSGTVTPLL